MKTLDLNKIWRRGITAITAFITVFCLTGLICQAAEGKVKAETAKIRADANTESEVVGSTSKGKSIDILEGVKDASGTVWYKVPVQNNQYGYIRGDLIETSENITIKNTASTGSSNTAGAEAGENKEKPAATVPTSIGEQKATITQASVRIRTGASTQHDTVASLPKGTVVTLIGEANDSAGNKWYQMTCDYNNKAVEGYIRADLITLGGGESNTGNNTGSETPGETTDNPDVNAGEATDGEATDGEAQGTEGTEGVNPDEGQDAEQPVAPEEEHNDYEIVYTQNESGEYEYYLYDNVNGTRQKLNDLMNVVNSANDNNSKLQSQIKTNKIIIIILAVIIVILVVAVTLLLFKVRDLYYSDYDEEDDEEEEEEEPVIRKKARRREEEEPVRRTQAIRQENPQQRASQPKSAQTKSDQQRPSQQKQNPQRSPQQKQRTGQEGEIRAAERKAPSQKQISRKSQNFLLDDDEFEFEFLNMDDKDL